MLLIIEKQAGSIFVSILNNNILRVFRCSSIIKLCNVTENALYCAVNGVIHRNIHSDERFIGTPPKEFLYLDVGIAKVL